MSNLQTKKDFQITLFEASHIFIFLSCFDSKY